VISMTKKKSSMMNIQTTQLLHEIRIASVDSRFVELSDAAIFHGGARLGLGEYEWPGTSVKIGRILFWRAIERLAADKLHQLRDLCVPLYHGAALRAIEQSRAEVRTSFAGTTEPDVAVNLIHLPDGGVDLRMFWETFAASDHAGQDDYFEGWKRGQFKEAFGTAMHRYFRDDCPPLRDWAAENGLTDPWCLDHIVTQVLRWGELASKWGSRPLERPRFTYDLSSSLHFPLGNRAGQASPPQLDVLPTWEPTLEIYSEYEERVLTQVRGQLSRYRQAMERRASDSGYQKSPTKLALAHFDWLVYFQVLRLQLEEIVEKHDTGMQAAPANTKKRGSEVGAIRSGIKTAAEAVELQCVRVLPRGRRAGSRNIHQGMRRS